jgi:argininosuccinate lyase
MLLKKTKFNKDRFEKELNGSSLLSTELVDYLVKKNVPFREAHNIVGKVVALSVLKRKKLNEISLTEYEKISAHFLTDLYKYLTAKSSIKNKTSKGSTSYDEVEKQIKYWTKKLSFTRQE